VWISPRLQSRSSSSSSAWPQSTRVGRGTLVSTATPQYVYPFFFDLPYHVDREEKADDRVDSYLGLRLLSLQLPTHLSQPKSPSTYPNAPVATESNIPNPATTFTVLSTLQNGLETNFTLHEPEGPTVPQFPSCCPNQHLLDEGRHYSSM